MNLPEHKRLRAVDFEHFMDRIDANQRTPAWVEYIARKVYIHWPHRKAD